MSGGLPLVVLWHIGVGFGKGRAACPASHLLLSVGGLARTGWAKERPGLHLDCAAVGPHLFWLFLRQISTPRGSSCRLPRHP